MNGSWISKMIRISKPNILEYFFATDSISNTPLLKFWGNHHNIFSPGELPTTPQEKLETFLFQIRTGGLAWWYSGQESACHCKRHRFDPVREDSTCHGANTAHVPQLLSPSATTTEAHMPRACAPHQEKTLQWEAHAPQLRVGPAHHN